MRWCNSSRINFCNLSAASRSFASMPACANNTWASIPACSSNKRRLSFSAVKSSFDAPIFSPARPAWSGVSMRGDEHISDREEDDLSPPDPLYEEEENEAWYVVLAVDPDATIDEI